MLHGLGLLAAIAEGDIRAEARRQRAAPGPVKGIVNVGGDGGASGAHTLGRFGWKAGVATLREQIGEAFAYDMGLSNPVVALPAGDCTASQRACLEAPHGGHAGQGGLEVGPDILSMVEHFVGHIAAPSSASVSAGTIAEGGKIFDATGCAQCHSSRHKASILPGGPPGPVQAYSDLLLHDMGAGLGDGRPEGRAGGQHWRTAPLWGQALRRRGGRPVWYLHDGRAKSLVEAILWHGGEAQTARDAFATLSRDGREALLRFLEAL
ncbi:MAG: di-heme oxidoredictase family protein [Hyphomicrobiaceae bacterium]